MCRYAEMSPAGGGGGPGLDGADGMKKCRGAPCGYAAFITLALIILLVFCSRQWLVPAFKARLHALSTGRRTAAVTVPDGSKPSENFVIHGTIDINTASAEELEVLPGIGERLARRIVAKRRELGGFRSVDELRTVKGIGKAKLDAVRALVSTGEPGGGNR